MGLEAGTTISDLDDNWPLSGDFVLEGDDHLRLIKAVLKSQFPGSGGQGYNTPILASETELNYSQGLVNNIQDQFTVIIDNYQNNLFAPAGTVMVFFQAIPPTGWTQLTANDDSMLRIVSGAGGGSGGDESPIEFRIPDHTHESGDYALVEDDLPKHAHALYSHAVANPISDVVGIFEYAAVSWTGVPDNLPSYIIQNSGDSQEPTFGATSFHGGGNSGINQQADPHDHGLSSDPRYDGVSFIRLRYIDVITAVKD